MSTEGHLPLSAASQTVKLADSHTAYARSS
jgi:hypothetical protein